MSVFRFSPEQLPDLAAQIYFWPPLFECRIFLNFVTHQRNEVELDKVRNDWTEKPNGQSHIDNIRDAGRSSDAAQGGTDIDIDRSQLEDAFRGLLERAKGQTSGIKEKG